MQIRPKYHVLTQAFFAKAVFSKLLTMVSIWLFNNVKDQTLGLPPLTDERAGHLLGGVCWTDVPQRSPGAEPLAGVRERNPRKLNDF
jgi:hypothetical protein